MIATVDDVRRADADAGRRGDTVTLLQDAAGSGQPVMFPGTRELRPVALAAAEPTRPSGGYVHGTTSPVPARPTAIGRTMMWLLDRIIALMRSAPAR